MTALAADRKTIREDGDFVEYPVAASTQIYLGSLVCMNASGYLVPAADTAGLLFAGVAEQNVDNSAGANGAENCKVNQRGKFQFATGSTLLITGMGTSLYIEDDQTVSLAADVTNNVFCGKQQKFSDAATAHLEILTLDKWA